MSRRPREVRARAPRTLGSNTGLWDELQLPWIAYHSGRLGVRLFGRHWRMLLVVGLFLFVWGMFGWTAWGLLADVALGLGWLTAYLRWRNNGAEGAVESVRGKYGGRRERARLRRQWPTACLRAKLLGVQTKAPPELRQVRWDGSGAVVASVYCGAVGITVGDVQRQVEVLTEVVGCNEVVVKRVKSGVAELTFHFRDPVSRILPLSDVPVAPRTKPPQLAYGIRQDGSPATIHANQSLLLGGLTRRGKSNTVYALLADCIRQQIPVALYISDPKGGIELGVFERLQGDRSGLVEVREYVQDAGPTAEMMKRVEKALGVRYRWMREHGVWEIEHFDRENRLVVVILDELLSLGGMLRAGSDSPLGRMLQKGSAAGYVMWANTQAAQIDVVGRLRDFVPQRICYATTSPEVTDAVLGRGSETAGARCSSLGNLRGVGFSYRDDESRPVKFRAALVPPTDKHLIAAGKLPVGIAPAPKHRRRQRWALYRWFDRRGRLLYVGKSNNAARRAYEHEGKSWADEAVRMEIETGFQSEDAVLEAEEAAIKREHPVANKVHNGLTVVDGGRE